MSFSCLKWILGLFLIISNFLLQRSVAKAIVTSNQWKESLKHLTATKKELSKGEDLTNELTKGEDFEDKSLKGEDLEEEMSICQITRHYSSPFRELIKTMPRKDVTLDLNAGNLSIFF